MMTEKCQTVSDINAHLAYLINTVDYIPMVDTIYHDALGMAMNVQALGFSAFALHQGILYYPVPVCEHSICLMEDCIKCGIQSDLIEWSGK